MCMIALMYWNINSLLIFCLHDNQTVPGVMPCWSWTVTTVFWKMNVDATHANVLRLPLIPAWYKPCILFINL